MGRFHRHEDGSWHSHDHDEPSRDRDELGDHSGYETGAERIEVLERIFGEIGRAHV